MTLKNHLILQNILFHILLHILFHIKYNNYYNIYNCFKDVKHVCDKL